MTADQPSQSNLAQLIKALKPQVRHFGPKKKEEINGLTEMFDVRLPSDYRWFLGCYGALSIDDVRIIGLADETPASEDLAVADITFLLRLAHIDTPLDLLPVEDLGGDQWACVLCPPEGARQGEVVLLDMANPQSTDALPRLAPSFIEYVYYRLLILVTPDEPEEPKTRSEGNIDHALRVFEKHVMAYHKEFEYDHAKGGKLPRNHDWRPYRYCIQDVVFGITVVRHLRRANHLLVDVFLTAEIPEYESLAGARALASFLLSEAYKCGGTMEIEFTNEVEGGHVPQVLQMLGERYGITFSHAAKGLISPAEAKALYAALTDFRPELRQRIEQMEERGQVRLARACYVVHHGVWTKEQVEMIVLGSELPDSILGGMSQPYQWMAYQHDLLHSRAALMGAMLDRLLEQRVRISEDGIEFDLEDDLRRLEVSFEGNLYAKRYFSEDPIPLPPGWLHEDQREHEVPARTAFHVLVRARDAADLQSHLPGDIGLAGSHHQETGEPAFVLVPHDFQDLAEEKRDRMAELAQKRGVG